MFRTSIFDKSLENATSNLNLEPDWQAILVICDAIRQGDANAKYAVQALKKKMQSPNPITALYALLVLESMVKNCGTPVHDEIANKANCEMFQNLVNTTKHEEVRAKMLELIQAWAYAFRSTIKYRSIKDTMNILKTEGHKFPELKEADAMFSSDIAPDWVDGDVCHRCRSQFTFTVRKHHCRNCGQVFCAQCSSKNSTLPKFGIEKEVRVCDGCYAQLQRPVATLTKKPTEEEDLPAEYLTSSLAQQAQGPARKTDEELREEEELQLALALSQSEAETKQAGQARRQTFHKTSPSPEPQQMPQAQVKRSPSPIEEPPTDPELARYLNRNYWEQRQVMDSPASPSAPSPMPSPMPSMQPVSALLMTKSAPEDAVIDEFSNSMKTQVEIFVNRMKSNSSRGRSISCDSAVQTLFLTLTNLHARLLTFIKDMDDKRMWYEQLQDKLTQIKDSRAALDVLRQEHQEKLQRIAEEQERQRQLQMAQKLEIMRKKKQEYLQYQRQVALQRIQEQEREMQMRQEQQKAQYRMGTAFPFMGGPQAPGQGPQNSPVHVGLPGPYGPAPGYGYGGPMPPSNGTLPHYPHPGGPGAPQQQQPPHPSQQMFSPQHTQGPQYGMPGASAPGADGQPGPGGPPMPGGPGIIPPGMNVMPGQVPPPGPMGHMPGAPMMGPPPPPQQQQQQQPPPPPPQQQQQPPQPQQAQPGMMGPVNPMQPGPQQPPMGPDHQQQTVQGPPVTMPQVVQAVQPAPEPTPAPPAAAPQPPQPAAGAPEPATAELISFD
ncbi:hepatocyte growth factor-regulated tyrosine kinase substrate [Anopheles ziemanni]|uniref:hepatocyte growth factor-regulated tyrosine kinase substrate n=1 Tax=Anopheles ziemanni TaxID=345580 RepID=UPI00265B6402|nr:hepatocyte growth factor-regulated tyrosine kinase substrate isoform X1 [Anopheles coustani]XP_058177431.1 hepatocyte growth factor-regulated tyrosine kinase substrate [Anopheles ziemanni]